MAVTSSTAPLSAQTSVLQELPSKEVLREIAAKQDAKQKEIQSHKPSQKVDEQREAAEMIQRNYRGYRERRRLQGFGLDPQTRWIEAVKEGASGTIPLYHEDKLKSSSTVQEPHKTSVATASF
ncbi:hypothetical protein LTR60_002274 [Cryomyces antarcticus]|nr:hypothetical protein LTR39_002336 [Cryomyces antarcticus]KAK5016719.1 hypothetical protein LTR60_002274 [Cryomyces antarcticus]